MKTIMDENYFDVSELSKMFGLSENTVRNYLKAGKITARKIGKSWFAKETAIKEYLSKEKPIE